MGKPTRHGGAPEPDELDSELQHAPIGSPRSAGEASERAALERALRQKREQIDSLDRKRLTLEKEARGVSDRIAALDNPGSPHAKTDAHESGRSGTDKVQVFLSLFRGREDVYPTRWEKRETGRSGYMPDCRNKWVEGLCNLKKVKCGACPNQAFLPADGQAYSRHLRGLHVMGVYPLLRDDTCWFLAMDFDDESWREDVTAIRDTCMRLDLPAYIERSRSGNGAHVWFFFEKPVSAADARQLGCHILTETMTARPELSFKSYDRLFPSQDTLPEGGFGNLIALPLQPAVAGAGNSLFLDDRLEPIPMEGQIQLLAGVRRIAHATVRSLVECASRTNSLLGVDDSVADDEQGPTTPWTQPLLNFRDKTPRLILREAKPELIRATLSQRLFLDRVNVPPRLLAHLKRLAAFQNPEFHKRRMQRLSTHGIPRIISCGEVLPDHLALPRGLVPEVTRCLSEQGIRLELEDRREPGKPLPVEFQGTLTKVQQTALGKLLAHDTGVFVAPPGVGKTVVGTALVAARQCSTLVLVHRVPLLEQWRAQLALFLGIDPRDVGQIGAGKPRGNGMLDVAMLQTLVRADGVDGRIAEYGQVIVDECHHLPAFSFERVLAEARARYVVGLTATLRRRDGHHPITTMQLGPVRFKISAKEQAARRPFEHKLIVRETEFELGPAHKDLTPSQLYDLLANDSRRNGRILDDVLASIREGRSPIVLTERRQHATLLASHLERHAPKLVVLMGGRGVRERRAVAASLAALDPNEPRVIVATGKFVGEGFDDARLDTLFLTMPISWDGLLLQYVGRLHRLHPAKTEVRVFDYVDGAVPALRRMFEKRLKGYRATGYEKGELPDGFELLAEPEYDEGGWDIDPLTDEEQEEDP